MDAQKTMQLKPDLKSLSSKIPLAVFNLLRVFVFIVLVTALFTASAIADDIKPLLKALGVLSVEPTVAVEISLKDIDGEAVKISQYRGKIVFVNFWTSWCPDCREEMPGIERLHKRFGKDDFVVLAINLQESAATARRFMARMKLSFKTLMDSKGKVGLRFGVRSIPTTYILNREGQIVARAFGPRDWDGPAAYKLFETLIAAKKVKK
jgi:thiol-disulfide isomerase/thioredoxin